MNFTSSNGAEEEREMDSKRDNIKFKSYNDPKNVADEPLEPPRPRHRVNVETSMRGSYFVFDSVQLMHC